MAQLTRVYADKPAMIKWQRLDTSAQAESVRCVHVRCDNPSLATSFSRNTDKQVNPQEVVEMLAEDHEMCRVRCREGEGWINRKHLQPFVAFCTTQGSGALSERRPSSHERIIVASVSQRSLTSTPDAVSTHNLLNLMEEVLQPQQSLQSLESTLRSSEGSPSRINHRQVLEQLSTSLGDMKTLCQLDFDLRSESSTVPGSGRSSSSGDSITPESTGTMTPSLSLCSTPCADLRDVATVPSIVLPLLAGAAACFDFQKFGGQCAVDAERRLFHKKALSFGVSNLPCRAGKV